MKERTLNDYYLDVVYLYYCNKFIVVDQLLACLGINKTWDKQV